MRNLSRVIVCVLAAGALSASVNDAEAVWRKFAIIEHGHPAPGSRLLFTSSEVNGWLSHESHARIPQGARNIRLQFSADRATGYANLDFLKLRQNATGETAGWLLRNLLSGERPVKVSTRFQSKNGRARVDVERVEISGLAIEGPALDFLIDNFVRPIFPYAVVSEWFDLQYGVDRVTVSPAGVAVYIRH